MPSRSWCRGGLATVALVVAIVSAPSRTAAQSHETSVARVVVDSAVSVSGFVGESAPHRPDFVVDVTAAMRLGGSWTAYVRPWFRKASNEPYEFARQIYQAAVQHQRRGRVSTRVDLGYILSPIGLGMMEMRPDTNPTITRHLSYVLPMPAFERGVPASMPIASSYPLGAQVTASTTRWDARAALVAAPPNRIFVLNTSGVNPLAQPTVVIGGGISPKAGLRAGVAYATGSYVATDELTRPPSTGRRLNMLAFEAEYAFGYTKLTGEFIRDSVTTATGEARATEWFVQGVQTLTPRLFVAARHEGANAPPSIVGIASPTLRISEATVGVRLSESLTLRSAVAWRKTYFSSAHYQQVGASLVWARRWW